MTDIPKDLLYTKSHEWVRKEEDGTCKVGITDHAQSMLGDFVFVDLPSIGSEHQAGDECCVVESVKAASDVFMPVSGTIKEVNDALGSAPDLVNKDPYGEGWLFTVEPSNLEELNDLLDVSAYEEIEKSGEH